MEALLFCAKRGRCSTGNLVYDHVPLSQLAKHIIASGIARVVYVEPYPKSKALEFHDDAITQVKYPVVISSGLSH